MTKYNIMIRPINKIKNPCTGEVKTYTLKPEQLKKLYRYLFKNFSHNYQEVLPDCKKCN